MLNNLTINAGQTIEYFEPGDFFRVMEAVNAVDLIFYRNGAEVARAEGVVAGYAERFRDEGFDRYRITSATTQTLQFVSRKGNDVAYDKAPTGTATITNLPASQGAFNQSVGTASTASTQFRAASATRRYLLVQNKSATGTIWVNLTGVAATQANGVRLLPGESLELEGYVPNDAVTIIGDIASNPDVLIVEG